MGRRYNVHVMVSSPDWIYPLDLSDTLTKLAFGLVEHDTEPTFGFVDTGGVSCKDVETMHDALSLRY